MGEAQRGLSPSILAWAALRRRREDDGPTSEVSEAERLKQLEDENAKLTKLLAETMLDNAVLKDIAGKNGDARRQARGQSRAPLRPMA